MIVDRRALDALLLAALRRTLGDCGELVADDPQLRDMLTHALDQQDQLTESLDRAADHRPCELPGAGRPAATSDDARYAVTIANGAGEHTTVEESYVAARCRVDGVALATGLRTCQCDCGGGHPHGTLVDGNRTPRLLFDIQHLDAAPG